MLRFDHMRQLAAVIGQFEAPEAHGLADNPVRYRITREPRNPLHANVKLVWREPALRQDFDESGIRIHNVDRRRCIVLRLGAVLRGDQQLLDALKLYGCVDGVRALFQHRAHRELSQRRSRGVDTFGRGLKPACNFFVAENLERVELEHHEAQVAAIRTPDSQPVRIDCERPAVRIQRQPGFVGFRPKMQCDKVGELAFAAMMLPSENLSGGATQFGKCFPIPWGRTHCLLEKAMQTTALGMGRGHQPPAVTPRGFTLPRMNSMIESIGVPGWNTAATPAFFSASTSWSGIMPPTSSSTSSIWFCFRRSMTRGTIALCAPERMLRPMTSTSSCREAVTIISGVWRRPV